MNLFLCAKPWAIRVACKFSGSIIFQDQDELLRDFSKFNPYINKIFSLHWHWIIPSYIVNNYECIGFHASDLPNFRGGSPIQNQLKRGIIKTKLSAFKLTSELDKGDIYLKTDLDLSGTMDDIFKHIEKQSEDMVRYILKHNPKPIPQKGKGSYYTRMDAL